MGRAAAPSSTPPPGPARTTRTSASLGREALFADRLRISPVVRFEILLTARDARTSDELPEELSACRTGPLTAVVIRARAGRDAHARPSLRRRTTIPIADYLVAAAQEAGSAVLHYDSDYDTLAEIMEFESIWLAPAGSVP